MKQDEYIEWVLSVRDDLIKKYNYLKNKKTNTTMSRKDIINMINRLDEIINRNKLN